MRCKFAVEEPTRREAGRDRSAQLVAEAGSADFVVCFGMATLQTPTI